VKSIRHRQDRKLSAEDRIREVQPYFEKQYSIEDPEKLKKELTELAGVLVGAVKIDVVGLWRDRVVVEAYSEDTKWLMSFQFLKGGYLGDYDAMLIFKKSTEPKAAQQRTKRMVVEQLRERGYSEKAIKAIVRWYQTPKIAVISRFRKFTVMNSH